LRLAFRHRIVKFDGLAATVCGREGPPFGDQDGSEVEGVLSDVCSADRVDDRRRARLRNGSTSRANVADQGCGIGERGFPAIFLNADRVGESRTANTALHAVKAEGLIAEAPCIPRLEFDPGLGKVKDGDGGLLDWGGLRMNHTGREPTREDSTSAQPFSLHQRQARLGGRLTGAFPGLGEMIVPGVVLFVGQLVPPLLFDPLRVQFWLAACWSAC
jgi:hypothetical protein